MEEAGHLVGDGPQRVAKGIAIQDADEEESRVADLLEFAEVVRLHAVADAGGVEVPFGRERLQLRGFRRLQVQPDAAVAEGGFAPHGTTSHTALPKPLPAARWTWASG